MFKLVLEKELKEIIGTTKFAVTFGVCAVLILLSFYVGARNYEVSREGYEASIVEDLQQMEGLTDWRMVNHQIFLPPRPLAALVSGVSNDIGRTIPVRTRGELRSHDSRFNEDPIFAVFRFLDLEFIFAIVLSLFAILFGYDAINGEKERGTLALSFANSVPRDQYVLGKLVGSFLALIVPLMIPVLMGCLLLPVLGVPMDGNSWIRLVMVILAGILYFGVFLTLSVFISTLTQRSSSSFLLLLIIWIFAVLIVPRAAVLAAGGVVEVPSVDEIDYEKIKYSRQLSREQQDARRKWRQEYAGDKSDREQYMKDWQAFSTEQADIRHQKMDVFAQQLNEVRENKSRAQQKVALGLARVSPAASFALAASELSSTSLELRTSYMNAAKAYRNDFGEFMDSRTGGDMSIRFTFGDQEDEEKPDPIDPSELPVFKYEALPVSDAINSALPDMALLLVFNIIFFAGAFLAFLRYDVR